MQNEVQAMLAFWHPHLELHGVALSQEHSIIFNMSFGARGTLYGTVVGVRDVEPSCLVHQCVRGSTFGGLSSRAYFHIATCKCALATFSMKASFVGGIL